MNNIIIFVALFFLTINSFGWSKFEVKMPFDVRDESLGCCFSWDFFGKHIVLMPCKFYHDYCGCKNETSTPEAKTNFINMIRDLERKFGTYVPCPRRAKIHYQVLALMNRCRIEKKYYPNEGDKVNKKYINRYLEYDGKYIQYVPSYILRRDEKGSIIQPTPRMGNNWINPENRVEMMVWFSRAKEFSRPRASYFGSKKMPIPPPHKRELSPFLSPSKPRVLVVPPRNKIPPKN